MAHDITDNRNEKLVDHVASVLVFPLSLILSLMGHLDSRLRGIGIRKGDPSGRPYGMLCRFVEMIREKLGKER